MRKVVRIMAAFIISAAAVFGMTACSEKGFEDVAVGVGHKAGDSTILTVIEATVEVDAKKNVQKVRFDEIMSVDSVTVKMAAGVTDEDNIVSWTSPRSGSTNSISLYRYVSIADKIYEAVDNEGVYSDYVKKGGNTSDADYSLKAYIATQAGAEWYYNAVKDGKCFIAKKSGENVVKDSTKPFKYSDAKGMYKRGSGYWVVAEGLGIEGNYVALETYLIEKGFGAIPSGTWTKGDTHFMDTNSISTGATMVDTPKYVSVAKAAYDKACAKIG